MDVGLKTKRQKGRVLYIYSLRFYSLLIFETHGKAFLKDEKYPSADERPRQRTFLCKVVMQFQLSPASMSTPSTEGTK